MKMKKILIAFMIVMMSCACAYAAENDDVYVRKDLFEAYMKKIDEKFDQVFAKLDRIDSKLENLTQTVATLNERVTRVEARVEGIYVALSNRIDGVEKRFGDLRTDVNIGIALIGLIAVILGLPVVQKWWEQRKDSKRKYLTAEDVERIVEAKMRGNLSNAAL